MSFTCRTLHAKSSVISHWNGTKQNQTRDKNGSLFLISEANKYQPKPFLFCAEKGTSFVERFGALKLILLWYPRRGKNCDNCFYFATFVEVASPIIHLIDSVICTSSFALLNWNQRKPCFLIHLSNCFVQRKSASQNIERDERKALAELFVLCIFDQIKYFKSGSHLSGKVVKKTTFASRMSAWNLERQVGHLSAVFCGRAVQQSALVGRTPANSAQVCFLNHYTFCFRDGVPDSREITQFKTGASLVPPTPIKLYPSAARLMCQNIFGPPVPT